MKTPVRIALLSAAGALALLAVVLCLLPGSAKAGDFTGGLHLATHHFGGNLKSETPGAYLRHSSGATGGCYGNSYDRLSCYAGWSWQTPGRMFAITAGAVTGYPARSVMPMLVPSVRLPLPQTERAAVRLAYLPKPMKHGTAPGLHLGIEFELEL
jgi:hypothetical protein